MVPRGESFTLDGSAAYDPDGYIASAYWTMSDDTVTAGQTISHTFDTDGAAWAYITVIDDEGAPDHAIVDVNVNIRPVAEAGPSVYADPLETVYLDGTLSSDDDGSIVAWEWDFGDSSSTSSLESPTHAYTAGGLYTITLTVTDNEGLTDTDTTLATIYTVVDGDGPLITHTEVSDGQPLGAPVTITANVQDATGVGSAVLWYRAIGGSTFSWVNMDNGGSGDAYTADIPGTAVTAAGVEYYIQAWDTVTPTANSSVAPAGAPTTDIYDFTVSGDPDPPTIVHTEIADGQDAGVAVTVSATITDATGVASANLYFRIIGNSSFGAAAMTNISGDLWTAQIPSFMVAAPGVEYYIEATDSSPIPVTGTAPSGAPTTLYDFTVGSTDTTPPVIAHTPIGDGQPEGTAIVITASIVDAEGVDSASVFYRAMGSTGAFTEAAMAVVSGTTWSASIPSAAVNTPGVEYYVSATDNNSNTATDPSGAPTSYHDFTVTAVDTAGPSITHTPIADGQSPGADVDIVATITDASGLSSAHVFYRIQGFPGYSSVPMSNTSGDIYEGTIPGYAVAEGTMEYYIRAIDAATPTTNTSYDPSTAPGTPHTFTITVEDTDAPVISHTPIGDGQTEGIAVAVSANIADATGVASATLYYRVTGAGSWSTAAMGNTSGDTWSADIPAGSVTTAGVDYYIYAIDSAATPNSGTDPSSAPTTYHNFTVSSSDTAGPSITHTAVTTLDYGDDLVITATITDTSGVASATLYWALDMGGFSTISMSNTSGDTWQAAVPGASITSGTVEVNYYIEATDTIPNTSTEPSGGASSPNDVTVVYPDTTPPTVTIGSITSPHTAGTDLPVSVTASDTESGVTGVVVYYRTQGTSTWFSVTASGSEPDFSATIPGASVEEPAIEIYAEATDGATPVNTGTSTTTTVTVDPPPDTDPPEIILTLVTDGQAAGAVVTVSANMTDDTGIAGATLYHRISGAGSWDTIAMSNGGSGDTYTAVIPGTGVQTPSVEYYVEAVDSAAGANTSVAPATAPTTPAEFTVTTTDTAPPTINHTAPTGSINAGTMLDVDATITDASGVASAIVYWRDEGAGSWTGVSMSLVSGDSYTAGIGPVASPGVEYYIEATDSAATPEHRDQPDGRPHLVAFGDGHCARHDAADDHPLGDHGRPDSGQPGDDRRRDHRRQQRRLRDRLLPGPGRDGDLQHRRDDPRGR